jgi:hypothetical protein
MDRRRPMLFALVLLLSVVSSSCWIPENFAVRVMVNRDGAYKLTFGGTLAYGMALAAKQGKVGDDGTLAREAAKLRQIPEFKQIEQLDKGRFKVLIEKDGGPGERYYLMSRDAPFFAVIPKQDKTVTVTAVLPTGHDIGQLAAIGAHVEGTLTVVVGSGVKVVRHNAQVEPWLFGTIGDYQWQVKPGMPNPVIVLQPSAS